MNRVIPGMASLQDYVTRQFPQHDIDVLEPRTGSDLELTDNTVVSYVVGNRAGLDLLSTFRRSAPNAKSRRSRCVRPIASVVPREDEDRDGVIDLPAKRVAAYVLIGLVTFGVIATVVAWMITDSGMTAAIYGCFAALVGAIVGRDRRWLAIRRRAGNTRSRGYRDEASPWSQRSSTTTQLPLRWHSLLGPAADYEVRIVDHSGGWRSPATGNNEP